MLHSLFDSAKDDQPPSEPELDIIAIHGLNFKNSDDHAWKTWTKGDKLWLRDFLPKGLSRPSRVMLFEYNSSPAIDASALKLSDHATNLLQWLMLKRKEAAGRPLVFVCHSLGGLVVKEALVAATLDATYKSIVESTRLLIFFATPHQGGNYASIGDVIAKIARTGLVKPGNNLLDALKQNSTQATTRFEQSRSLYDSVQVVSFFEGQSYGKMGIIVDKKSATLNLSGRREKQIGIHADHSAICKFDSIHNSNCELVLETINIEVEEALKFVTATKDYIPSYPLDDLIAPVKMFVQRPDLLHSIRDQFKRPLEANRQGEVRKVGLWGMGGAGKTQLARNYLWHYRKEYDASFWIRGDQPAAVDRDFLAIYHLLLKPDSPVANLSSEDVKREVLSWFTRNDGRFLFVFDGADYLEKIDDNYVALRQYFPRTPNVHIIITSRSSIARKMSTFGGVSVGELNESQSVELFLKCAEMETLREIVAAQARLIVSELGNLALAVSMAGSYISQTPRLSSNLTLYLDDLRRHRRDLLPKLPDETTMNYSHSVMTVLETSCNAVSKKNPDACLLLKFLSFIHFEDIFPGLFSRTNGSHLTGVPSWTSTLGFQRSIDMSYLGDCFHILQQYSLCHHEMVHNSYSIHRLVHSWGFDRLRGGQEAYHYWIAATQFLGDNIQAMTSRSTEHMLKLRVASHVTENLNAFMKLPSVSDDKQILALNTVEHFYSFFNDIGRWKEAAFAEREVLQRRERILGDDHPSTISAMNNLASTLGHQGKLDEAAQMQREVLEKMKRILGDEHPDTITAMNNLASTLSNQGKTLEATQMKREVLEKMKRILGDDHPSTILAMNNLASTLSNQGKMDEAAQMQCDVLEKMKQILGDEHPDTITAMNNLESILSKQGKLSKTAFTKTEVFKMMQQILVANETYGSHRGLTQTFVESDAQSSRNSMYAQSLFSEGERESSVTSSTNLDYAMTAMEQIVGLFVGDAELKPLLIRGMANPQIGEDKLERNFSRLLFIYSKELRDLADTHPRKVAAKFVARSTKRISAGVRHQLNPTSHLSFKLLTSKNPGNAEQAVRSAERLNRFLEELPLLDEGQALETDLPPGNAKAGIYERSDDSSQDSDIDSTDGESITALGDIVEFLKIGHPFNNLKRGLRDFITPNSEPKLKVIRSSKSELGNVPEQGDGPDENVQCHTEKGLSQVDADFPDALIGKFNRQSPNFILALLTLGVEFPRILPELVDRIFDLVWFAPSAPSVPTGKTRIRWKCQCGVALFEDLVEIEPGSLKDLETRLQKANDTNGENRLAGSVQQAVQTIRGVSNTLGLLATTRFKFPWTMWNKRNSPLPLHGTNSMAQQDPLNAGEVLHLLLCIDNGEFSTKLHHARLQGIYEDHNLFQFLRKQYFKHRNFVSWFTLRSVKTLSLARFAVDANDFAGVHCHAHVCTSECVCLPPIDRIDRDEYRCDPAPKTQPSFLPAIGPNQLTHYFLKPHALKNSQRLIYNQLPKRACGQLKASPDETQIGWGIHFEEGWHWRTIYFVIVIIVAVGSLLFGLSWSLTKGDIQGAFAIAASWMALGPLLLGYVAIRDCK